jgi:PST family polysaccharide transporter
MADRSTTRRLFKNIASITVFQASGYILAMLNVPYLTRTLGVADYGVLAFTMSVNAYLWLVMDWGFSLGATRDIAQAQGDENKIREIFWRTMTAKAILSVVALAALVGVAALDKVPDVFYIIFLPGALNILSAIMTVDWLVQGLQRMGLFTLYSVGGRAFVVALTFILVHGPQDTWIACCLQTFGSLVASSASFLIVRRYFKMGRPVFPFRSAARQIWDYRHYFLSQSSWIAYSTAAPLLLTIVSGSVAVGLFAGAERITRIAMSLIYPLSTAIYPHVNALVSESREAAANVAGLLLAAQVLFGLALSAVFFLGARPIAVLVLGSRFSAAAEVLRCLAVLPLLTGVGSTLSRQFMIPLGYRRAVSRITLTCTAIYLVLLFLLGRDVGALGAAIALITTEVLITLGCVMFLIRRERTFTINACLAVLGAPTRFMQLYTGWRSRLRSS